MEPDLIKNFKDAMASFPTGVTIVTTRNGRKPVGITVSSFTSLSMDPPLVLICLNNKREILKDIKDFGAFAVNILPGRLEHPARVFAGLTQTFERFNSVDWDVATTGCPVLLEECSWLDCQLTSILPGGDHRIVIGQVLEVFVGPGTGPLLYFQRELGAVSLERGGV